MPKVILFGKNVLKLVRQKNPPFLKGDTGGFLIFQPVDQGGFNAQMSKTTESLLNFATSTCRENPE
jgi:hypothetical protein